MMVFYLQLIQLLIFYLLDRISLFPPCVFMPGYC